MGGGGGRREKDGDEVRQEYEEREIQMRWNRMTYGCSIDEEELTKECTNFSYTPGLEKSPLITETSHTTHINIHSFTGTFGDD